VKLPSSHPEANIQLASLIMESQYKYNIYIEENGSAQLLMNIKIQLNIPIPGDNVHISIVGLDRNTGLLPCPYIPNTYLSIHRTRGKNVGFCGTPLQEYDHNI
jgi:hypothetical protein